MPEHRFAIARTAECVSCTFEPHSTLIFFIQKWTGSAFGITTRIPKSAFKITKGETKKHVSDNGSGIKLHREFCDECGGGILEYGVRLTISKLQSAYDNHYYPTGKCWGQDLRLLWGFRRPQGNTTSRRVLLQVS